MKKTGLLLASLCAAVSFLFSQAPTLGSYQATNISTAGRNTVVAPSSAPASTNSMVVYTSASFKGLLYANPATGVVTITNAHPAGSYTIVVKAVFGLTTDSTTFILTVGNTLCSQGAFIATTTTTTGNQPRGIAVADVNNDGIQDLLTSDYQANTVTAKLGNGAGSFSTQSSVVVGAGPGTIVTADFDNDGKVDIATANITANTISVRLGDGTGNFNGTTNVSVGTNPVDIAIGDFNGDGKQDIATANQTSGTVSIRLGDGVGGFSGNTNISTGAGTSTLAVADFDDDGKQDFVAVTYTDANVLVYRGDGSGNFTRSDFPYSIGSGATDVVTGDFNSDGFTDIAVVGESSKSIAIATGDGTGKVRTGYAIAYTPFGIPHSATVGDFNGDGRLDVAASSTTNIAYPANSSILLFLNPGVIGFNYNVTTIAAPNTNYSLATGDFNADGRQDMVASSYYTGNAIVLLSGINNIELIGGGSTIPNGSNYPTIYDYTDFGNVAGSRVTPFTIRNSGTSPLTISNITTNGNDSANFKISRISFPAVVAAGATISFSVVFSATDTGNKKTVVHVKSNNCDKPDYSFSVKACTVAPYVLIRYGDTVRQVSGSNNVVHVSLPVFNASSASATTSTSFKGLLSINPVTGLVSVSNAQPAGNYRIITRFYNNTQTFTDSFLLVVQPPKCSSGYLVPKYSNVPVSNAPSAIATADFNNDNRPDLAIVNSGNSTVQIALATDTGRFTAGSMLYTGIGPRRIAIADINNDGYQDFVTANYNSRTITRYLGDGFGGFTAGVSLSTSIKPTAIALADVNKDGWQDMIVASDTNINGIPIYSTLQVYLGNRSTYSFGIATNIQIEGTVSAIAISDFNNDGYPDIAAASGNRDLVFIRLNNGSGGFTTGTNLSVAFGITDIATGDFNNDGKTDFTVVTTVNKSAYSRMGNGVGGFTNGVSLPAGNTPSSIAVTDLNGDGKLDWAFASSSDTVLSIWTGDGMGFITNYLLPRTESGAVSLASGDFNSDGIMDVAAVNTTGNTISVNYGRSRSITASGNGIEIPNNALQTDSSNLTYFIATRTDTSNTHTFTIKNTGTYFIDIHRIFLTGTDSLAFTSEDSSYPLFLQQDSTVTFTITFSPTDGGIKEAKLNILTNDCNNANYSFLVRGKALCTNLSANNIWLGLTANWNAPSNWSLGAVPNGCGIAVVNAGVPFMPQISTNASCYSLTLNNGATFTVTGIGNLTITGP